MKTISFKLCFSYLLKMKFMIVKNYEPLLASVGLLNCMMVNLVLINHMNKPCSDKKGKHRTLKTPRAHVWNYFQILIGYYLQDLHSVSLKQECNAGGKPVPEMAGLQPRCALTFCWSSFGSGADEGNETIAAALVASICRTVFQRVNTVGYFSQS